MDLKTYTIGTWFSPEDNEWVASVYHLGGPDHTVHISALGADRYSAIAEVSKALKAWEEAND